MSNLPFVLSTIRANTVMRQPRVEPNGLVIPACSGAVRYPSARLLFHAAALPSRLIVMWRFRVSVKSSLVNWLPLQKETDNHQRAVGGRPTQPVSCGEDSRRGDLIDLTCGGARPAARSSAMIRYKRSRDRSGHRRSRPPDRPGRQAKGYALPGVQGGAFRLSWRMSPVLPFT